MSITLAKTILGSAWMIDPAWAQHQTGLIMHVLKGGTWGNVARNSEEAYSKPYLIDTNTNTMHSLRDANSLAHLQGLVAFVPITGPIMKYDGECGEPGSVQRTNYINLISRMQNVKTCIFLMDTPGGMIDGLHTISNAIANMTQHTVAFVDDGMMCSAGMYIAAHCKEIVASKATDTIGSIGVLTTYADWAGYYEKEGLTLKTVYAPQSTEKNLDYRELLENDNDTLVKEDLSVVCQQFIDLVSTRRAKAAKHVEKWSHGATFFASEAAKVGLIDRIETLETTIKRVGRMANNPTKTKSMEQNTSNQMATVLTAAGAESFGVIAEGDTATAAGFVVSEEHVNNIASKMLTMGGAEISAKLERDQATDKVTDLQQQLNAATAKATQLEAQVGTLTTERDRLQAQVAELGKAASGTGTSAAATDDQTAGTTRSSNGMPSWYKSDGTEAKLHRATAKIGMDAE